MRAVVYESARDGRRVGLPLEYCAARDYAPVRNESVGMNRRQVCTFGHAVVGQFEL
jgi:hypothetical protein